METIDLLSIITIAFLGSFGHCVGMCGGIVIAYSSTKVDVGWSRSKQALSHLLYSFGRITTYVILGVMFGYLGGVTTFSNEANGILLIIAGVAMILAGLSLLGKIKFLTVVEHTISTSGWYRHTFKTLLNNQTLLSFFLLGMLNGLLPCGFVYFFAITAASTASPLWGGVVMLVFGLSTIPALFSLGFFVGLFKQSSLRGLMIKLASIAVIVYGGYTFYSGYEYIVNPDKTILDCHTKPLEEIE
ncbi:MAG: sulfite exporter TauE/SafE family protein [Campylobacterota bacterium]|nr:sulfite exporter TauE/SafE family protein [Campylobacterota bacterium]